MTNPPKDAFDEAVREYIDFVNEQVGVYMSALAGFAGHHARVSRQVHRANRPTSTRKNEKGETLVVWASYEDPTKPDIVHNQIIRSDEYLEANRPGGRNEQQHSRAIIIFLFTYWEDEIRPRLARAKGVLRVERHATLKVLGDIFVVDEELEFSYEGMHRIFVLMKQDCARLLFDWLGIKNGPVRPEELRDVAIQIGRSRPGPS